MNSRGQVTNTYGFTLIELMITMVISGLILSGIYSAYTTQQRIYNAQEAVAEMQQNIRAAMELIAHDIRLTGYDPLRAGTFGFVNNATFAAAVGSAQAVQMASTVDLDGDGTIDLAVEDINGDGRKDMTEMEQIGYRLNGTDLERYSAVTGFVGWQDIAENIQAIEFRYLDSAGAATAVLDDVRSVQVSILARAGRPDPTFTNNMTYTPASGTANNWVVNDNFRRRLLITTVKCRNMGL